MIGSKNPSHFQSKRGGLRPGTRFGRRKAEVLVAFISMTISALFFGVFFANFNPASESSTRKGLHSVSLPVCDISSIADMHSEEMNPVKGERHMVQPPAGSMTLVCCETTAGPLQIAVHPTWAPNGSERFLSMVKSGYFSSKVALMRCIEHYICKFGIAGKPMLNNAFSKGLADDPNWLPEGPNYRVNESGVKRFAKGYLAYAGSGKNSRSNQLIVALNDNELLGGRDPWEVPFGEIVGHTSFSTLDNIYTGYGNKGPSPAQLRSQGSSPSIAKEFPLLDYITSCNVVDDGHEVLATDEIARFKDVKFDPINVIADLKNTKEKQANSYPRERSLPDNNLGNQSQQSEVPMGKNHKIINDLHKEKVDTNSLEGEIDDLKKKSHDDQAKMSQNGAKRNESENSVPDLKDRNVQGRNIDNTANNFNDIPDRDLFADEMAALKKNLYG